MTEQLFDRGDESVFNGLVGTKPKISEKKLELARTMFPNKAVFQALLQKHRETYGGEAPPKIPEAKLTKPPLPRLEDLSNKAPEKPAPVGTKPGIGGLHGAKPAIAPSPTSNTRIKRSAVELLRSCGFKEGETPKAAGLERRFEANDFQKAGLPQWFADLAGNNGLPSYVKRLTFDPYQAGMIDLIMEIVNARAPSTSDPAWDAAVDRRAILDKTRDFLNQLATKIFNIHSLSGTYKTLEDELKGSENTEKYLRAVFQIMANPPPKKKD